MRVEAHFSTGEDGVEEVRLFDVDTRDAARAEAAVERLLTGTPEYVYVTVPPESGRPSR